MVLVLTIFIDDAYSTFQSIFHKAFNYLILLWNHVQIPSWKQPVLNILISVVQFDKDKLNSAFISYDLFLVAYNFKCYFFLNEERLLYKMKCINAIHFFPVKSLNASGLLGFHVHMFLSAIHSLRDTQQHWPSLHAFCLCWYRSIERETSRVPAEIFILFIDTYISSEVKHSTPWCVSSWSN